MTEIFESDEFGTVGGYASGYQPEWSQDSEIERALDEEFLNGPGWESDAGEWPVDEDEGFQRREDAVCDGELS
jgi:hypothetical protein